MSMDIKHTDTGQICYPFSRCRICKASATGVHYGVITCEGCKGFFKRSIDKSDSYRCYFGGCCSLTPDTRNRCKACRFQRCIRMGMAITAVKMGRIPKRQKEKAVRDFLKSRKLSGSDKQSADEYGLITDQHYELNFPVSIESPDSGCHSTEDTTVPQMSPSYSRINNPRFKTENISFCEKQSYVPIQQDNIPTQWNVGGKAHGLDFDTTALACCSQTPDEVTEQKSNKCKSSDHCKFCHSCNRISSLKRPTEHTCCANRSEIWIQNHLQCDKDHKEDQMKHDRFSNEHGIIKCNISGSHSKLDFKTNMLRQARELINKGQELLEKAQQMGNCFDTHDTVQSTASLEQHTTLNESLEKTLKRYTKNSTSECTTDDEETLVHNGTAHDIVSRISSSSGSAKIPLINTQKSDTDGGGRCDSSVISKELGDTFRFSAKMSREKDTDITHYDVSNSMGDCLTSVNSISELEEIPGFRNSKRKFEVGYNSISSTFGTRLENSMFNGCSLGNSTPKLQIEYDSEDCLSKFKAGCDSESSDSELRDSNSGNSMSERGDECDSGHSLCDLKIERDKTCTSRDGGTHCSVLTAQEPNTACQTAGMCSFYDDCNCGCGLGKDRVKRKCVVDEYPSCAKECLCGGHCKQGRATWTNFFRKLLSRTGVDDCHENTEKLKLQTVQAMCAAQSVADEIYKKCHNHFLNYCENPSYLSILQDKQTVSSMWENLMGSVQLQLKRVLNFTKEIPGFEKLNHDGETLLKFGHFDVWMIEHSKYFYKGDSHLFFENGVRYSKQWMLHFLTPKFVEGIFAFAEELNSMQLTRSEIALLKGIVLTNPNRPNLEDKHGTWALHCHLLDTLLYELEKNHQKQGKDIICLVLRMMPKLAYLNKLQQMVINPMLLEQDK